MYVCVQCTVYSVYGMEWIRWLFSRRINHTPSTTLVHLGAGMGLKLGLESGIAEFP